MAKELIHTLGSPLIIKTRLGNLPIANPNFSDIPQLLDFLHAYDSDTRGFELTAHEGYKTMGKGKLETLWEQQSTALAEFSVQHNLDTSLVGAVQIQSQGILSSKHIMEENGVLIKDPFNMQPTESSIGLQTLQQIQLQNTLVVKNPNQIIASVRLLEIGTEVEIVDLAVDVRYRRNGIAGRLVQEALSHSTHRPIYSFMVADLKLIRFYNRQYAHEGGYVPTFDNIPPNLQGDLAHMNQFWGPNIIMKISGNK